MPETIQISLLPENSKNITVDLRKKVHLLIAGVPEKYQEEIFENIIGQLEKIPMIALRKIDFSDSLAAVPLDVADISRKQAVAEAAGILDSVYDELNARYRILAQECCKNIEEYHRKKPADMPYIVLVIQRYDLVGRESAGELVTKIVRIAQKARAAGIHILLGTLNAEFSGALVANFPSTLIGQCAAERDSLYGYQPKKLELAENEILFHCYQEKDEKITLDK